MQITKFQLDVKPTLTESCIVQAVEGWTINAQVCDQFRPLVPSSRYRLARRLLGACAIKSRPATLRNGSGVTFRSPELRTKVESCAELDRPKRIGEGMVSGTRRNNTAMGGDNKRGSRSAWTSDRKAATTVMAKAGVHVVMGLQNDRSPFATTTTSVETKRIPQSVPNGMTVTNSLNGELVCPAVVPEPSRMLV